MIKKKPRFDIVTILLAVFLLIMALVALFPFAYMFLTSLTQKNVLDLHFDPSTFSFYNYERVFKNLNMGRYFFNSTYVTAMTCLLNNIICAMAAYGFAKKRFPGRDKIFFLYIATLMVPSQVKLIPIYTLINKMGLMNTYTALILPLIDAFGVFLMRQFMFGVPDELLEAAKIDGCNEFSIFTRIVVPLIKPVIISLTIFTFITSWNNFMWPLVVSTNADMHTLTLAIATLKGNYTTNYGLVMAGSTIAFLPPFLLYIVLQKQFVEGIALSGIKG